MDYTTDPSHFPRDDMKDFIEELHKNGQRYGEFKISLGLQHGQALGSVVQVGPCLTMLAVSKTGST
jgi:hypothetical protein